MELEDRVTRLEDEVGIEDGPKIRFTDKHGDSVYIPADVDVDIVEVRGEVAVCADKHYGTMWETAYEDTATEKTYAWYFTDVEVVDE